MHRLEEGLRLPIPQSKRFNPQKIEGVYKVTNLDTFFSKNEQFIVLDFQIMLTCWTHDAKARPTFDALYNDLRDFDTALEERYDYSYSEFMKDKVNN